MNYSWLKFNHLFKLTPFSQPCILCNGGDNSGLNICRDCLADLPFHASDQCPQCGLPSLSNQMCGACIASPPDFDSTRALFRYEYPVSQLLQHYKYQQQLYLANTFTEMLLARLPQRLPDLIIPMPLHPKRLSERGFNQSLEIARIIAKRLSTPLDYKCCERIKWSLPQASLPLKQRVRNMKGAFQCQRDLSGLNVVMIDDVMTTGASLNALAKAIKAKGAAHVECWVIARTLPRQNV